ncbi:MAG TPA: dephospho-CoA kinase [Ignavibacteria bacterium]
MKPNKLKRVGITGGIGSGKSEACKILEQLGEVVLYADLIAKDLTDNNANVISQIKKYFGIDYYDKSGKLNRKKLADLVFNDPKALETLNSIVHPEVFKVIDKEIEKSVKKGLKKIFIEAALIFESGMDENLDLVVLIDADEYIRYERVKERDRMTKEEFIKRVQAQMPSEEKVKLADFTIKNNGSLEELKRNIIFINDLINNYYFKK